MSSNNRLHAVGSHAVVLFRNENVTTSTPRAGGAQNLPAAHPDQSLRVTKPTRIPNEDTKAYGEDRIWTRCRRPHVETKALDGDFITGTSFEFIPRLDSMI